MQFGVVYIGRLHMHVFFNFLKKTCASFQRKFILGLRTRHAGLGQSVEELTNSKIPAKKCSKKKHEANASHQCLKSINKHSCLVKMSITVISKVQHAYFRLHVPPTFAATM
jgi:hypothetical protein